MDCPVYVKKSREQKDLLSKLDVLEESKEINNYYVDSPNLKFLITAWKVLRKLDPITAGHQAVYLIYKGLRLFVGSDR